MTLLRQIMFVMLGLFVLLFCANFALMLQESRVNLTAQMEAHAQDTATALGISMRDPARQWDVPMMELLIAATFDHGYYADPNDCSSYCYCAGPDQIHNSGLRVPSRYETCIPGLVWDPICSGAFTLFGEQTQGTIQTFHRQPVIQ